MNAADLKLIGLLSGLAVVSVFSSDSGKFAHNYTWYKLCVSLSTLCFLYINWYL